MSGIKLDTAKRNFDMMKETGLVDTIVGWYQAIYDLILNVVNLGEYGTFFMMMFIFGSICSFLVGGLVWFAFELTYFIKVHLLKENKKKVFKDLVNRLNISMRENNIR